jgi:DMSO/TMAO reductase YedYZ molybdopterin-dependent catalytic subunit
MLLRCDNCRWWDHTHPRLEGVPTADWVVRIGYCRKHKPVVFSASDRYWGGWPLVDAADFCGEHMPLRKDD